MYAVYGLNEKAEKIEEFIGYVPASFFESFTDPTGWKVKMMTLPSGDEALGRLFGRALFVQQSNLRASKAVIAKYMGLPEASPEIADADTEV